MSEKIPTGPQEIPASVPPYPNIGDDAKYNALGQDNIELPKGLFPDRFNERVSDSIKILPDGYVIHREDNSYRAANRPPLDFNVLTCDDVLKKVDSYIMEKYKELERLQRDIEKAEHAKDALKKIKKEISE